MKERQDWNLRAAMGLLQKDPITGKFILETGIQQNVLSLCHRSIDDDSDSHAVGRIV